MKRQDEYPTPPGLDDFFQPGEKQEYGGEIQDNSSLHAFRIFRDKDSGGVRFEATARRGPLKTVPIWTAFVTQYIGHRGWMKRVGHATVQFRELHPYVFHQGYGLPRDKKGRFQITFSLPQGEFVFVSMMLWVWEIVANVWFRCYDLHGSVPWDQSPVKHTCQEMAGDENGEGRIWSRTKIAEGNCKDTKLDDVFMMTTIFLFTTDDG